MPEIIPIKELRNTTEISDLCHKQKEPVFVTKNGYGDLVIMSMETYERKIALADVYQKLNEAEIDVKNGDVVDGEEVFQSMRLKYGR